MFFSVRVTLGSLRYQLDELSEAYLDSTGMHIFNLTFTSNSSLIKFVFLGIESPVGANIPGRLGPRSGLRMLPAGTGQGFLFDTSSSPSTALLNAVSSDIPNSLRYKSFT